MKYYTDEEIAMAISELNKISNFIKENLNISKWFYECLLIYLDYKWFNSLNKNAKIELDKTFRQSELEFKELNEIK